MAEGLGDMKGFVAEWEKLKAAFASATVLQDQFLGSPTSIKFSPEETVVEF